MTFGERLKQLREERGLSLETLAKVIGVSRATVYKYETGDIRKTPTEKMHVLANFFGVSRPYLMGWTDERNADPNVNLDMVAEKLRETAGRPYEAGGKHWKPAEETDCITAATQALRALVKFKVSRTPVYPQQILQASPLATMITYSDPAEIDQEDPDMVALTVHERPDGSPHYLFAVNRNAPIGELSLMLSVNIGHIYLGHMGDPHVCSRRQEAECFAVHLRYPRPMIRLLTERGYVLTRETFSRIFGYCDTCLDSMLKARPVVTSPELNRLVKEQFTPYVNMLEENGVLAMPHGDDVLDFSAYMAGYEE